MCIDHQLFNNDILSTNYRMFMLILILDNYPSGNLNPMSHLVIMSIIAIRFICGAVHADVILHILQ